MADTTACSSSKSQRQYKTLPVWVVEDHNDALQHIYRAIASRHLPFSGVTMLHLDSHPDLQIATDMDADIIYDREELISSISIENWIMPSLYAGHIDHVIWAKPPWADQLPEGTQNINIGKDKDTGKLRVTWPDDYFLSDLLYAPISKLQNAKPITVDTVTIATDLVQCNSNLGKTSVNRTNCTSTTSECKDGSGDTYFKQIKRSKLDKNETKDVSNDLEGQIQIDNSDGKTGQHEEKLCNKTNTGHSTQNECDTKMTESHGNNAESETVSCKQNSRDESNISKQEVDEVKGHVEVITKAVGSTKPFILDIDLDFFSTKNPFREVYTKDQFKMLEELYSFRPPSVNTEEVIEYCQIQRALQLKELEACVKAAWDGTDLMCEVDTNRFEKVKSLVFSLQSCPPSDDPLDSELIHMAGLTCDDSGELPHHISTEAEIDSLLEAVKELLFKLPKPTIITVARSSRDDYCPPDQVNSIQSKCLETLRLVYGEIDVHLDYEKPP